MNLFESLPSESEAASFAQMSPEEHEEYSRWIEENRISDESEN